MPFTVSHVVAALPFNKHCGKTLSKYTALSPLVIGSMTPDIAYLTPILVHQRMDSHSLIGLYLFCIPMGLTVFFLYHFLMAPVWFSMFPKGLKARLHSDLSFGKVPSISSQVLLLSLIIGASTHIFWDFLSHQRGIPQVIAWMDQPLMQIDGYDIMPYRVIQHVSSILGLALLLFIIFRWYKRTNSNNTSNNYWQAPKWLTWLAFTALFVLSSIIAIIYGMMNLPETDVLYGLYSAQIVIRHMIVMGAGVFLLGSLLLGIVYQFMIYQQKNTNRV